MTSEAPPETGENRTFGSASNHRTTIAAPTDQKFATTSGIVPPTCWTSPTLATWCAPKIFRPTRSVCRKVHPTPYVSPRALCVTDGGIAAAGEDQVADEDHAHAHLQRERPRRPRLELGRPEQRRETRVLTGNGRDRNPGHFVSMFS